MDNGEEAILKWRIIQELLTEKRNDRSTDSMQIQVRPPIYMYPYQYRFGREHPRFLEIQRGWTN